MAKKVKIETTETNSVDHRKTFKLVGDAIDKKFPKMFHAWLYEEDKLIQKRFSTGSVGLDTAMGGQGLPFGRLLEVWGPTGGGKTSFGLETAWNLQRNTGLGVVVMDLERKFDGELLTKWKGVGFDHNMTRLERPDSGEDTFSMILDYLDCPGTGIIIVDSVSAIRPSKILDDDNQSSQFGSSAKLIAEYLPKISSASARSGIPILFINQVRVQIGGMPGARGRAKYRKWGGTAYDHWMCVSLYLDKSGKAATDGVRDTGQNCRMIVYKNHSGPTLFKEFSMFLHYGFGFDTIKELVDMSILLGIIQKSGSWFSVQDIQEHGKDPLSAAIASKPEVQQYLWEEVQKMQISCPTPMTTGPSITLDGEDAEGNLIITMDDIDD